MAENIFAELAAFKAAMQSQLELASSDPVPVDEISVQDLEGSEAVAQAQELAAAALVAW